MTHGGAANLEGGNSAGNSAVGFTKRRALFEVLSTSYQVRQSEKASLLQGRHITLPQHTHALWSLNLNEENK